MDIDKKIRESVEKVSILREGPSIYDSLLAIRAELVYGMSVEIEEEGVVIKIGQERFQVDDSAPLDAENQVNSFFSSASWLAGMRLETD